MSERVRSAERASASEWNKTAEGVRSAERASASEWNKTAAKPRTPPSRLRLVLLGLLLAVVGTAILFVAIAGATLATTVGH